MAGSTQAIVVCEQCDAAHRWRSLASHEVAHCSRCGAVLGRGHRIGVEALLALTLAAAVVFLIANLSSIATIHLQGRHLDTTLHEAIAATWQKGARLVAVTAALTAIVAPAVLISLRLYLLVPLHFRRTPKYFGACMRLMHEISRWNMVEVLMVAAIVSIVRMAALAQAAPGPGMWAHGTMSLLLAALETGGLRHLWTQKWT
jgi:paraquat-inducible protein A